MKKIFLTLITFSSVFNVMNAKDNGTFMTLLTNTKQPIEVIVTGIDNTGSNYTVMRDNMEYSIDSKYFKRSDADRDLVIDLLTNQKRYQDYMLTGKRIAMKSVNKTQAELSNAEDCLRQLEKMSN